MEQRMILAAKNGTPIDVDGRAYFIQDDMDPSEGDICRDRRK